MKGLKIVPMFLCLIVLSYFGMMFVEANREEVSIHFMGYQSPPIALGFAILTSALIGMVIAGSLSSVEILALYFQNKNLKRRIAHITRTQDRKTETTDALTTVAQRSS